MAQRAVALPSLSAHIPLILPTIRTIDPNLNREILKCKNCGLVQYRSQTRSHCPRCLLALPPETFFSLPKLSEASSSATECASVPNHLKNRFVVEGIGKRVRAIRTSRGWTQGNLQHASRVSRSYLSRVESGEMTPSIATLENIAAALDVHLSKFFTEEDETWHEDPFIEVLKPYVRHLTPGQRKSLVDRLKAITE